MAVKIYFRFNLEVRGQTVLQQLMVKSLISFSPAICNLQFLYFGNLTEAFQLLQGRQKLTGGRGFWDRDQSPRCRTSKWSLADMEWFWNIHRAESSPPNCHQGRLSLSNSDTTTWPVKINYQSNSNSKERSKLSWRRLVSSWLRLCPVRPQRLQLQVK